MRRVFKGQHIRSSGTEILRDGVLAVDLTNNSLYIHDGVTPGGVLLDGGGGGVGNKISNGSTQVNIPDPDGDIEIDGDVELYGGLTIHSAGEPLGRNDIVFFDGGTESGRITSEGETGGAIQIQAEVSFEVKVSQDDGAGGTDTALWTFGSDGKLALPADGDIVDSNGDSVLGGGSADTGDITFVGTTISTAEDEQRIEIQTRDDDGEWNTRITMDPEDVYIRMEVRNDNKVSRIDLDQFDNRRITIEGRDVDMVVDVDKDIDIHSGDDIDITADDRMRITGDRVRIRSNSSEDTVEIVTDNNDTQQTWEFRPNGVVKMPGATIQGTNTATDTGEPVALDLTKAVHKLANGDYTLADGAEGQIIYIVPQTGATPLGVELYITSARVVSNSNSGVVNDNLFLPFSGSVNNNLRNVVTLIFTDGAWNLSGGEWD